MFLTTPLSVNYLTYCIYSKGLRQYFSEPLTVVTCHILHVYTGLQLARQTNICFLVLYFPAMPTWYCPGNLCKGLR
jgi:hypothetical protein